MGSSERRKYYRVDVGIEATVYIDNQEFTVTLKDISENGISFIVENNEKLENLIKEGESLGFASIDNYLLFDVKREDVIIGKGIIVRFDEESDNSKVIGVSVKEPDKFFEKYVDSKKIALLCDGIKGM